jgi:inner membrane protein
MDNLTHSLVGVMLSRAGLSKAVPRASLLLLMAANAPDIDVVSAVGGAGTYFEHHRGITHALIAMPAVAFLPVLVMRWVFRKPAPWLRAWIVSLIGIASHLALDYTNAYGIRLWLPFSDAWPALDITSVVDVWIWAVLLLAMSAPAISRLVSLEIGARKTTGQGWAIFALLFVLMYDTGRYFLHQRAIEVQRGRVYEGAPPHRVLAFPLYVNPFSWRGYVETDQFWAVHSVNLAQEFDPTSGRLFYKPDASPAIEAARATPVFRHFLKFSKAPLCRSGPADDPANYTEVECRDLRFGFAVTALISESKSVDRAWFHFN